MQNVEGKVVIITGASSGIGEETARVLYAVSQPDNVDISDIVVRPTMEG